MSKVFVRCLSFASQRLTNLARVKRKETNVFISKGRRSCTEFGVQTQSSYILAAKGQGGLKFAVQFCPCCTYYHRKEQLPKVLASADNEPFFSSPANMTLTHNLGDYKSKVSPGFRKNDVFSHVQTISL